MSSSPEHENKVRRRIMVPRISHESSSGIASEKDSKTAPYDLKSSHSTNMPEEIPLSDFRNGNENLHLEGAANSLLLDEDLTSDIKAPLLPLQEDDHSLEDEIEIEVKTLSESDESALSICLQVFIPYIIAGFGTVGAGMVLDIVQHWNVFQQVPEVFILVPALLGLKGNLEMTLASRLSTQSNLGNMETKKEQLKMIGGNIALTQAQAIVVGFLASLVAMIMGWIPEGKFNPYHALLLCASSMLTASIASFILGSVMAALIILSKKCHINPDNVATPIAASLGDLTTLSLLSTISHLLYHSIESQIWLGPFIIILFILLTPLWIWVSSKNKYTCEVLYTGWTPVISAMVISSIGGLILDFTVSNYHGIAVFQPVINGVGGNLVAVQASRLSTGLHKISTPGHLPSHLHSGCPNPIKSFCGSHVDSKSSRVMLFLVIPGHLIFMYTISFMMAGHTTITFIFASIYLTTALLQVALLLYIANWMVIHMWKNGNDPDNFAIPYLTAIGDLTGTAFLAVAFHILYLIGDRDADVGD
ncbi:solute carrier family 41 member 1 isoform X1 [Octopus bimaculoides]|uniref:SLC41A/MgtE integral membrane domain-containing protein n=1 Tax=Octopus bimaculoides TaxID=37653 RepID=A0A0L8HSL4_OCTBM|nr:solute carrier family 41 member 1 isoform X1 [Octopus bimaculoides]XP_014770117.1 solute carrier family 41 member 1 isoform X1 [Octopus bimaculoides]XP_014770118.1 solute carrier family 41 member 1 isoform X1 [Octopus bimaculoides]XP_014770119.1 solute carrier family 41 member 1 isoform X1 [Octopus bimaculoides]XP_014770120.1 solute carrier family 41 member 1 isoform X1 [Octopus bimaculoides]|eukprot:XP_014770116.1 PREDICTED: solute carrier family 41 member 1-like isoform X1 [Octopus bimaculoides]